MKKAKIILTAIAVFAVIGGALAFKTARYNEFPLWTIYGTVTTSIITGGCVYTATVPICSTIPLFDDPDGPFFALSPRFTTILSARGTCIGGPITVTTLIPYIGCPTFPARFVGLIQ